MTDSADPKHFDQWIDTLRGLMERGVPLHQLFPPDEVKSYSEARFTAILDGLGIPKSTIQLLAHMAAPAPQQNNQESSPPVAAAVAAQASVGPPLEQEPDADLTAKVAPENVQPPKSGDFFNVLDYRWYTSPITGKTTKISKLTEDAQLSEWRFVDGIWYIDTRPAETKGVPVPMPEELRKLLDLRNSQDDLPPIALEEDVNVAVNGAPPPKAAARPKTRFEDSGVFSRMSTRTKPDDPDIKEHVKKWWSNWSTSHPNAQLATMTGDEQALAFVRWLNQQLNLRRLPDLHKVPVIHEVAYKFQLTRRVALRAHHLDQVRRPNAYIKHDIRFFNEATNYLGYAARII